MIKAKRLRHARLVTAKFEQQLDYYRHIIGLTIVAQEAGRAFLASEAGQLTIVLERGSLARLDVCAFDVAPDIDLSEIMRGLREQGIASDLVSDATPGQASALRFRDPEGRGVELFATWEAHENRGPIAGIAPAKLGHVASYTSDPEAIARYYGAVLGFRVSDWIEDRFVFMRCGYEHHTLNFARGSEARAHHIAFELRDAAHMHRACDILGGQKIPLLWGPVRHGPGHNVAIYHRDPDGHVIELFYDLDRMVDEDLGFFDPRPWHRDRPQRPKIWVGLPRDVWGSAPSPELPEFSRSRPTKSAD